MRSGKDSIQLELVPSRELDQFYADVSINHAPFRDLLTARFPLPLRYDPRSALCDAMSQFLDESGDARFYSAIEDAIEYLRSFRSDVLSPL